MPNASFGTIIGTASWVSFEAEKRGLTTDTISVEQCTKIQGEVARCAPFVMLAPRYISKETTVAGRTLVKGDFVMATCSDFQDRVHNRYFFGWGKCQCPGSEMATKVLHEATKTFHTGRLERGWNWDVSYEYGNLHFLLPHP